MRKDSRRATGRDCLKGPSRNDDELNQQTRRDEIADHERSSAEQGSGEQWTLWNQLGQRAGKHYAQRQEGSGSGRKEHDQRVSQHVAAEWVAVTNKPKQESSRAHQPIPPDQDARIMHER